MPRERRLGEETTREEGLARYLRGREEKSVVERCESVRGCVVVL